MVIKTPSNQTYQVHLQKMSTTAQKQRQAFCFLVMQWYSGCMFGMEGHILSWTRGMDASSVSYKQTQMIYTSHAADFQQSSSEITFKKRLFEQMTPHLTQFFHKGCDHAVWRYRQFTLFISVWKSLTCDNRIGLRPRNTRSQICRSRAGYICLHVIQSTS